MKLAKASEKSLGSISPSLPTCLFKLFTTLLLGVFLFFLVLMAFYLWGARGRVAVGLWLWNNYKSQIGAVRDWRQGSGVNMYALLPDFVPYTEVNRHKFDKPGWLEIYP